MNKLYFFISVATIFVLERALQTLLPLPIFIFPVFIIFFMLGSRDEASISYALVASIFFDFFSGFKFGVFTASILAICFSIYLFKRYFNVSVRSGATLIVFSAIFTLEFIALLSMAFSGLVISEIKIILVEAMVVSGLALIFAGKKLLSFQ